MPFKKLQLMRVFKQKGSRFITFSMDCGGIYAPEWTAALVNCDLPNVTKSLLLLAHPSWEQAKHM